jgi:CO dehydrogenase maturation factor
LIVGAAPVVAVIGKGGVGKTTITALLLGQLIETGRTPVLAVDADPSSCLGGVLGTRVNGTLGVLRDRMRSDDERPASVAKSDWLALMAEDAIVEEKGFDLLTMGHPEGPGCYCFVNNLVRDYLERLSSSYRLVLVDCEAGQEHLSRRTTRRPDRLVCVTNRSRMGAETIRRSLILFDSLHGSLPDHMDLVLNGLEPDELLAGDMARAAAGESFDFSRVWTVPHDPQVASFECEGRSLLGLTSDTPARKALAGWEDAL